MGGLLSNDHQSQAHRRRESRTGTRYSRVDSNGDKITIETTKLATDENMWSGNDYWKEDGERDPEMSDRHSSSHSYFERDSTKVTIDRTDGTSESFEEFSEDKEEKAFEGNFHIQSQNMQLRASPSAKIEHYKSNQINGLIGTSQKMGLLGR